MTTSTRRAISALWAIGVCLLATLALGAPAGLPGRDAWGTGGVALALAGDAVIDLGDPLIADDHVAFMDRGAYPYQDRVCGAGCGAGRVNVVHGNLVYTRRDFLIPGRGLPLEITFTYNSGSFFQGRYGYGWQLNYDLRYITNSANDNVIVVREDDRTDIFVELPDGTFRSTYGVRDTLQEYAPDRYVLVDRQGVKYWFESGDHHYVTRIEDLNGNTLTLAYNAARELIAVTEDSGRQLTLTYTADKLTAITDPAGHTWHYAYDGAGNLVQVTDPLGGSTQYGYAPECHDLVSITDARGNSRIIAYNAAFQVASLGTCCGSLSLSYDPAGRRTTVTDANGHATIYQYDARKRVVAIEDALGYTTTRTWDAAYNLTGVIDAKGQATAYTYDARGNRLTETDPLGGATVTTWHPTFNQPATVADPLGRTTTYTYDAHANLLSSVDPVGQPTTYAYDPYGQLTDRTDARGHTTHWTYDADGNRLGEFDAQGGVTKYTYDAIGNELTTTDANDHTTAYGYDGLSRLVVITDALGYTLDYSYDPVGNRIGEGDENGELTRYGYDELDRLAVITDALGCVTAYGYDPVGNLVGETDANGHTTSYGYDPLNRQGVITDPLGYLSVFSYDPLGNRIAWTDANGHTTAYGYDGLSRLVVITDALSSTLDYSYDPVGNRIGERDENGELTRYGYDELDHLAVITDALGYTTAYGYDPVGNLIGETDANGHTTAYGYDGLDRQVVVTDALGYTTAYGYDPVGNLAGETDANGHTTAYGYDPLNRQAVITDALGYTLAYSYDPVGNRIGKTDALGRSWSYVYSAVDRLLTATSPLGHQTVFGYDCAGNTISRTDPNGATTGYSYDEANRLLTTSYPAGRQVHYQYDGAGNLLSVAQTGGWQNATSRSYDALNRLAAETIDYGPFVKSVSYTYDGVGNILTLTDPDGQVLAYGYDPLHRVQLVTDPSGRQTSMVYDPAGRVTETVYAHGVWTATTYDAVDQSIRIATRDAANALIAQYDYAYDPVGQLLSAFKNGVPEAVYQYNAAGWLTDANYTPLSHDYHYTYDPVGNRLTRYCPICGELTTYIDDAEDRVVTQVLPGPNPINYGYDANANVVQTTSSWGVVTYAYDFENRLTQVAYPPGWGTIASYYSPEGRQLARDERGQWTYYYPTLLGVVVEMDAAGQTTARLNPGISLEPGGGPADGSVDATAEATLHWDGQGSTTCFTDDDAGQVASLSFGYFGEPLAAAGDVDGVDPGLTAIGLKVGWDPVFPGEMFAAGYWPDIAQLAGGTMVSPGAFDLSSLDPSTAFVFLAPFPFLAPWDPFWRLLMDWIREYQRERNRDLEDPFHVDEGHSHPWIPKAETPGVSGTKDKRRQKCTGPQCDIETIVHGRVLGKCGDRSTLEAICRSRGLTTSVQRQADLICCKAALGDRDCQCDGVLKAVTAWAKVDRKEKPARNKPATIAVCDYQCKVIWDGLCAWKGE